MHEIGIRGTRRLLVVARLQQQWTLMTFTLVMEAFQIWKAVPMMLRCTNPTTANNDGNYTKITISGGISLLKWDSK